MQKILRISDVGEMNQRCIRQLSMTHGDLRSVEACVRLGPSLGSLTMHRADVSMGAGDLVVSARNEVGIRPKFDRKIKTHPQPSAFSVDKAPRHLGLFCAGNCGKIGTPWVNDVVDPWRMHAERPSFHPPPRNCRRD